MKKENKQDLISPQKILVLAHWPKIVTYKVTEFIVLNKPHNTDKMENLKYWYVSSTQTCNRILTTT